MDPGGVLVCHDDELRGGRIAGHRIGAPHYRTTEMGVENSPGSARKSDVESHGHIPLGHASPDEWKRILASFRTEESGPISALIAAIDLPDGPINTTIGVVDGVRGGEWAPAM